jgi:hypothetical protein
MTRPSHPKKEVEEAVGHAEEHGWRVEVGRQSCLGEDLLSVQR